jgi:hypothetical protein
MKTPSPQRLYLSAIAAFATIAPMSLVSFAYQAAADSVERSQIVVHGCEQIVALLAVVLVLRASYLFGFREGLHNVSTAAALGVQAVSAAGRALPLQPKWQALAR